MLKGSWRTKSSGILVILSSIMLQVSYFLDDNPATNFDLASVIAAVSGLGLYFARDDKVTSEQSGAKDKERADIAQGKVNAQVDAIHAKADAKAAALRE